MFVAGIGVVWGTMQALLWLQQAQPLSWHASGVSYALAAGLAVAASNLLLIESLTHMDVSLGSTVYRLNTVVVVALSFIFLAEAVGTTKLLAVGFGVAAALVLYHGTQHGLDMALARRFFWLAVLASVLRACFGVISKAALVQGVSYATLLLVSARLLGRGRARVCTLPGTPGAHHARQGEVRAAGGHAGIRRGQHPDPGPGAR